VCHRFHAASISKQRRLSSKDAPPAETLPATEQEIDAFLAAFEAGTLAKERFTHTGHLLTGACFVHMLGEAEAIGHMRLCVRRFNEAVGGQNTDTGGYHESITVFWIKILAALHAEDPSLPRAQFAALAVDRYRNRRDLFREFYDFDLVASTEARRNWIPPTLKQIVAAQIV
jgi:hypothetical protein